MIALEALQPMFMHDHNKNVKACIMHATQQVEDACVGSVQQKLQQVSCDTYICRFSKQEV